MEIKARLISRSFKRPGGRSRGRGFAAGLAGTLLEPTWLRLRPSLWRAMSRFENRVSQVAQGDLGSEFCGEPRQPIRAAPRTDAAVDADHERIEGEAVTMMSISMFVFCSTPVKPLSA